MGYEYLVLRYPQVYYCEGVHHYEQSEIPCLPVSLSGNVNVLGGPPTQRPAVEIPSVGGGSELGKFTSDVVAAEEKKKR